MILRGLILDIESFWEYGTATISLQNVFWGGIRKVAVTNQQDEIIEMVYNNNNFRPDAEYIQGEPESAFDTDRPYTGSANYFSSPYNTFRMQSIHPNFSSRLQVDYVQLLDCKKILINNYHDAGADTINGIKDVKIYAIPYFTDKHHYQEDVPKSEFLVFDGQIPQHSETDERDDFEITLPLSPWGEVGSFQASTKSCKYYVGSEVKSYISPKNIIISTQQIQKEALFTEKKGRCFIFKCIDNYQGNVLESQIRLEDVKFYDAQDKEIKTAFFDASDNLKHWNNVSANSGCLPAEMFQSSYDIDEPHTAVWRQNGVWKPQDKIAPYTQCVISTYLEPIKFEKIKMTLPDSFHVRHLQIFMTDYPLYSGTDSKSYKYFNAYLPEAKKLYDSIIPRNTTGSPQVITLQLLLPPISPKQISIQTQPCEYYIGDEEKSYIQSCNINYTGTGIHIFTNIALKEIEIKGGVNTKAGSPDSNNAAPGPAVINIVPQSCLNRFKLINIIKTSFHLFLQNGIDNQAQIELPIISLTAALKKQGKSIANITTVNTPEYQALITSNKLGNLQLKNKFHFLNNTSQLVPLFELHIKDTKITSNNILITADFKLPPSKIRQLHKVIEYYYTADLKDDNQTYQNPIQTEIKIDDIVVNNGEYHTVSQINYNITSSKSSMKIKGSKTPTEEIPTGDYSNITEPIIIPVAEPLPDADIPQHYNKQEITIDNTIAPGEIIELREDSDDYTLNPDDDPAYLTENNEDLQTSPTVTFYKNDKEIPKKDIKQESKTSFSTIGELKPADKIKIRSKYKDPKDFPQMPGSGNKDKAVIIAPVLDANNKCHGQYRCTVKYYNSFITEEKTLWCADYTTNLKPGQVVGTLELSDGEQIILPKGKKGLGVLRKTHPDNPSSFTAGAAFYNFCLLPGWEKWRPTYRLANILEIAGSVCTVFIKPAFSRGNNIGINPIKNPDYEVGEEFKKPDYILPGWEGFKKNFPTNPLVTNTLENEPIEMTTDIWNKINEINTNVNNTHKYKPDVNEEWSELSPGQPGDCDNFVLTKAKQLQDAGIPVNSLKLVPSQIKTATGKEGHLILMLSTNKGDFVLDNINQNIVDAKKTGYEYIGEITAGKLTTYGSQCVLVEVPAEYMTCDCDVFETGDEVVIEFPDRNWETPKLIGFRKEPRKCPPFTLQYETDVDSFEIFKGFLINNEIDRINIPSKRRTVCYDFINQRYYRMKPLTSSGYTYIEKYDVPYSYYEDKETGFNPDKNDFELLSTYSFFTYTKLWYGEPPSNNGGFINASSY